MGEDTGPDQRTQLVVEYKEQAEPDDNMSQLSAGDHSYIMDLAHQKHHRQAMREEEAKEEALELFNAAVEEGAPMTKELYHLFVAKVLMELAEENREKDRLQDEWLEAALQGELERRENSKNTDLNLSLHSQDSLGPSFHQPPSIYNGAKNTSKARRQSTTRMIQLDQQIHQEEIKILKKKIKKVDKSMNEIVNEKGEEAAKKSKKYKNFKKKIKEYRATLKKAKQDERNVSMDVSMDTSSVMYDWGTTDDGDDQSAKTEQLSTSSRNATRRARNRSVTEDVEWVNREVDAFALTDDAISEKNSDIPETKREPPKMFSVESGMATNQQMSGHELTSQMHDDTPQTPGHTGHRITTPEGCKSDEAPIVFPGSAHVELSPRKPSKSRDHALDNRKSPSSKTKNKTPKVRQKKNVVVSLPKPMAVPPLSALPDSPTPVPSKDTSDEKSKSSQSKQYTLADFEQGRVPDSVDMAIWEEFLSTAEFEKCFGMTREAFGNLPAWKRGNARRQFRTW